MTMRPWSAGDWRRFCAETRERYLVRGAVRLAELG
jgi:hypothetical protein